MEPASQRPAVTRHDQGGRGEYHLEIDGAVSKLTYQRNGDTVIADYTFVPPHQRGGDNGRRLVEALVEDARSEGFKIVPTCGYIAATMRRHPEWNALRA